VVNKVFVGMLGLVVAAQASAQAVGPVGIPYVPMWVMQPQPQWMPIPPLALPQGGAVPVLPPRQVPPQLVSAHQMPYPTPFWMWYVPSPAPAPASTPAPVAGQTRSPAAAPAVLPATEQKTEVPQPVLPPIVEAVPVSPPPAPTPAPVEPVAGQSAATVHPAPEVSQAVAPEGVRAASGATAQPTPSSEPQPAPALVPPAKARTAAKQRSTGGPASTRANATSALPAKAGKNGTNGKKSRKLCWKNGRLDVCE
jgi:hypothetical protein